MTNLPINQMLCGDCIAVMNDLPEKSIDVVFADPPYNMQLQEDLYRPDQTKVDGVDDNWDKFDSFADYDKFTKEWLTAARRVLKDEGTIWVMGSYHNVFRVGYILQNMGFWILNKVEWVKLNPLPQLKGTRFCEATETLIWAAKCKDKKYTFNYKILKAANEDKQLRTDWHLPVCRGAERVLDENGDKAHNTQKPEALLRRVILASTKENDIILDPFAGTATTCAVAKKLGRRYIGLDNEQKYIDLAVKRLAAITACEVTEEKGQLFGLVKPKVSFLTIVECGLLEAGQLLTLYAKPGSPTSHVAKVNEDGTVTSGTHCGSIHHVGKTLLDLASCNGWVHWYYDEGGLLLPIDTLRDKYFAIGV